MNKTISERISALRKKMTENSIDFLRTLSFPIKFQSQDFINRLEIQCVSM